jgi:hypothetical protein
MSALGMKVDDIEGLSVNDSPQRRGRGEIEIITNRKRPEPYVEFSAVGVQQSVRIG